MVATRHGNSHSLAKQRAEVFAMAVVLVIGVALRAAFIDRVIQPDEAWSYHLYISTPLIDAISTYDTTNNHPLHSVLAHFAISLFGNHPLALRSPAFFAGILIVPAVYKWAKQEYGDSTGVLAAALAASSSFLVDYSTQARGYSIVALLFVVALILARRLVTRWTTNIAILLGVVNALALFTIPVAVYSVGIVIVWLLTCLVINGQFNKQPRIILACLLMLFMTATLTVLFYFPILTNAGLSALIANPIVQPRTPTEWAQIVPPMIEATKVAWINDVPIGLVWLMLACLALSLAAHSRIATSAIPVALTVALLPPIITIQQVVPYTRIFLFLMPLYLSNVAGGFTCTLRLVGLLTLPKRTALVPLLAIVTAAAMGGILYENETASNWNVPAPIQAFLRTSEYLAGIVRRDDGLTGSLAAVDVVGYYLDIDHKPVVLISSSAIHPYPQAEIPSHLYVLVHPNDPNPLRSARFLLGQIHGFDPTAYTEPQLLEVIDDLKIYVVSKR